MNEQKVISEWQHLQALYESLKGEPGRRWLFRGQRDYGWDLASTLERTVHRKFGEPLTRMPDFERWLLAEFKRHAHRYSKSLPDPDDTFRWLSLMQHHGAPTRLIDFTYSFYVGVYFAIECTWPGEHSGLWAIDGDWCWQRARQELDPHLVQRIEADATRGKTPELQAEVLKSEKCVVVPDNSFFLDERLAVQQGVFLVPLDLSKPFIENLGSAAGTGEGYVRKYDICCTIEFLKAALLELRRMNITRVSLFPGLDGLATSLQSGIAITDLPRAMGLAERAV